MNCKLHHEYMYHCLLHCKSCTLRRPAYCSATGTVSTSFCHTQKHRCSISIHEYLECWELLRGVTFHLFTYICSEQFASSMQVLEYTYAHTRTSKYTQTQTSVESAHTHHNYVLHNSIYNTSTLQPTPDKQCTFLYKEGTLLLSSKVTKSPKVLAVLLLLLTKCIALWERAHIHMYRYTVYCACSKPSISDRRLKSDL